MTKDNASRYRRICDAFLSLLPDAAELSSVAPSQLLVTYWPVDASFPRPAKARTPDAILQHYAYGYAAPIQSFVKKNGSRGPILVAFDRPWTSGMTSYACLVLDMSDFSDEDIDEAFRIWKEHISSEKSSWQNGIAFQQLKAAFVSLANKYGEQIVDFFRHVL